MSMEAMWYFTQMPSELITLVEKDLQQFDSNLNTAQTANRTINFRATSSETLDSVLNNIDSITAAVIVTNGSTPYYFNTIQVDGSTVTPKYQGGVAITSGNASSLDVYSFTILKTGSGTFEVLVGLTKFA